MNNIIKINNLEVFAYHGVHQPEKDQGQRFYINAVLHLDFQAATYSDDLDNTVHYGFVSEDIIEYFQTNRCDLIESITHQLVNMLFSKYPILKRIELEVVKPWAPLKFSFDSVSTRVDEVKTKVYLGLGSNVGDSEKTLKQAIAAIAGLDGVYTVTESKLYSSAPYGEVAQDDFLNMAVMIETNLHPTILLKKLQKIELDLGRTREIHWGPRTIDIDMILYGKEIIAEEHLLIPHRFMCERDFVLKPLLDLNPNLIDPRTNTPLINVYEALQDIYIREC
ncbi:2-amino-4-hydroxy-6-hydroxymethyldihydropteridine diphosphokinase [Mollicutes bacterium LVI A0039]|nr:2-amino-4-hydroxy-6-hydroxymethyldihydropteridine diphosphokinase [Mollicutes bacterium LVI A0039]